MSKTILKLNASLAKEANCLEYLRLVSRGYTQPNESGAFKMEFGTAFHKGIASWRCDKDVRRAIEVAQAHYFDAIVPEGDFRNERLLAFGINKYCTEYEYDLLQPHALPSKEKPKAVEVTFAYPIFEDARVIVMLCGTIDLVGSYGSIPLIISDIKTTSLKQYRVFLNSYKLSPQLMTYVLAIQHEYPEFKGQIAAMIDGVFLGENNVTLLRCDPIFFTPHHLHEWSCRLNEIASDLASIYHADEAPRNFSCCDKKFGLCSFFNYCSLPSEVRQAAITRDLQVKEYDPLKFQA